MSALTRRCQLGSIRDRKIDPHRVARGIHRHFIEKFVGEYELSIGTWSLQESLPLHLCDLAMIVTLVALAQASREKDASPATSTGYELAFYWSLGGTVQALITPYLTLEFPNPRFFTYFVGHGTIAVSVAALTIGAGMRLRNGSALRAWLITNAAAAPVLLTNYVVGSNYMFLCGSPPMATIVDYLGEWPWPYLLLLDLLALGIVYACYGMQRIPEWVFTAPSRIADLRET